MRSSLVAVAVAVFALSSFLAGCGPTVSEHVVDVEVDDDGNKTHGVLRFPDHEEEIEGADDSCGLFSGNCGTFTRARAEVSGDAPILGASMETAGDGEARTYDLSIQGDGDPADAGPYGPNVQCRIYYFTDRPDLSGFGAPTGCYNTKRRVSVTLTFRDGDDGR